jgi:hypothetical protein
VAVTVPNFTKLTKNQKTLYFTFRAKDSTDLLRSENIWAEFPVSPDVMYAVPYTEFRETYGCRADLQLTFDTHYYPNRPRNEAPKLMCQLSR